MTARTLITISAGLSQPSATRLLAGRLTDAAVAALAGPGITATAQLTELREHAHDITNALLSGVPTGDLPGLISAVAKADGLIVVTPIFSASFSGLFKMFFDILDPGSLTGVPVLIGATGNTPRHSLALEHAIRPLFSYLRTATVPTAVYAAAEDWGTPGEAGRELAARVSRAAAEFAALVAAGTTATPDPYGDPVPFEQLLSG